MCYRSNSGKTLGAVLFLASLTGAGSAREFHVSVQGDNQNDGSPAKPMRTITAAAAAAQPGDTITVHTGTYRERVTPPRGGDSESRRIVYQAAPGEEVILKGSELVRSWKPFHAAGVWKLVLPNSFFGNYNPYKDLIAGDWFNDKQRPHHTGEVYLNGKSLYETNLLERVLNPLPAADTRDSEGSTYTWFTESDDEHTYIYANFHDKDPNRELVEINVRDSCFYPDQPGRNYITVRGFHMSQAATQWAPPTAEQVGLIGTHWSKGWIIEDNVISDSKCAGLTLGKDRKSGQNVWSADRSLDGSIHYVEVILRALQAGWSRDKIGSHIVRRNTIFNCEQAGIAGSLGAVASVIAENHVYDIWTKRQFAGAEIAGIKLHGAVDVVIERNRVHNAGRGLWMDWMAQGTRISSNLVYDNTEQDLFMEVDHGPFLVDNNVLLSSISLRDMSEGGAYAHNLIAGRIVSVPEPKRSTPYLKAHATAIAGMASTLGGDDRYYNNVFAGNGRAVDADPPADATPARSGGYGLWVYNFRALPLYTGGNVYLHGARPYARETGPLDLPEANPRCAIVERGGRVYLRWNLPAEIRQAATQFVDTGMLGKARVPDLPYESGDGSRLVVDRDYFGRPRKAKPAAGPFENPGAGEQELKVW